MGKTTDATDFAAPCLRGDCSQTRWHLRYMLPRDLWQVLAIEMEAFADPWREEDWRKVNRIRDTIAMVVEDLGSTQLEPPIVGYVAYHLAPHVITILNLAVGQAYRGRGMGREIVDRLKAKLAPQRRRRLVARVHEPNLAAQLFFRACGFRCVGIDRGFFEHSRDGALSDAYQFVWRVKRPGETGR